MKRAIIPIIIAIIMCASFAIADYSSYQTYGNDGLLQHDISGYLATAYNPHNPINNDGSDYLEQIVYDYNGDSINDLITAGKNGKVYLIEGNNVDIAADDRDIGYYASQGVACDVGQTGKKEYVAIYQIGGDYTMISMSVTQQQKMNFTGTKNVTATNIYANLQCSQFFYTEGDQKYYVLWVSNDKRLHYAYRSGSTFIETTLNPENAATKEINGNWSWYSNHQLVIDPDWDYGGHNAALYMAGNYLIAYLSNDDSVSKDIAPYINIPTSTTFQSIESFGGLRTGESTTAYNVYNTGYTPTAGGQKSFIIQARETKDFFGVYGMSIREYNYSYGGARQSTTKIAVQNNNRYIVFRLEPNSPSVSAFHIIAPNMTLLNYIAPVTTLLSGASSPDPFTMSIVNDDIIFPRDGSFPGIGIQEILTITNGSVTEQNIIGTNNTGVTTTIQPITLVDFDRDGFLDIFVNTPTKTIFYMSNGTTTSTQQNYPFTVITNTTNPLSTVSRIDVGYNFTNYVYNYAVACDISENTIWNEQFNLAYNFSQHNVSFNVVPPEGFLSYYGMVFTINATLPQFDLYKNGNNGARDYLRQRITMQRTGNNSIDYLVFASDYQITYWLRFNKTGTNVEISKIVGGVRQSIANYTSALNTAENIVIDYVPQHDYGLNIDYFTTTIKNGNVTIVTDSTFQYTGVNIKDVELYSDTIDTTLTINNFGLFKTSDVQPSLVEFQNGQRFYDNGIIITNPPPNPSISGQGFTVIPDYNSTFYAICPYNNIGNYTQRHYIAPTNTIDYTNYKEITVTITNTTGTGNITIPAGDNEITSFFTSIFGESAAVLFLIWMGITLIVTFFAFMLLNYTANGGIFAIVVFISFIILGGFLGMLPIWVIIILLIICGLVFASGMQKLLSGGG